LKKKKKKSPEIDSSSLSVTQMEDHFVRCSTLGHTEKLHTVQSIQYNLYTE